MGCCCPGAARVKEALRALEHTDPKALVAAKRDTHPQLLLATFAPFERRLISQRTRQALASKRAQGVRLGRPPTISAYVIDRIRRERAAGKSLAAIANALDNDRVPTAWGA